MSKSYNKGEENPNSILTDEDVADIRRRLKDGVTGRSLAEEYSVTPMLISLIKNNKRWVQNFEVVETKKVTALDAILEMYEAADEQ